MNSQAINRLLDVTITLQEICDRESIAEGDFQKYSLEEMKVITDLAVTIEYNSRKAGSDNSASSDANSVEPLTFDGTSKTDMVRVLNEVKQAGVVPSGEDADYSEDKEVSGYLDASLET